MNSPALPPPLPSAAGKSRVWVFVAVALVLMLAVVVAGAMAVTAFRRVQERKAAARAALEQFEKTAREEQAKMADLIVSGDASGQEAAVGRVREQLEKSAGQLGGDGGMARAMAGFLGKMQGQMHEYEIAVAHMAEADVFSFHPSDKATLETHRQIVRDFLAANARFTKMLTGANELLRAELDAAKIPAKARDAALEGALRSQKETRPLQLQIRQCDETLGESALAILDLLEKEWGRWRYDEAAKVVRFDDKALLSAHGVLMEKIHAAGEEQADAQARMAAKMRMNPGP